jgi:hypothetical protein
MPCVVREAALCLNLNKFDLESPSVKSEGGRVGEIGRERDIGRDRER